MNYFIQRVFISLLISSSILLLEVISQVHSNCPSAKVANLTNGVTADLIKDDDGVSLLGIRVEWSIKPEYLNCQFHSSRIVLMNLNLEKVVNVTDGTAVFTHDRLHCNREYRPILRVFILGLGLFTDDGTPVFYGGTKRGPPSQLLRVCVGPPSSLAIRSTVNISWDPLLCLLQNGADIAGYIIQYTRLSTGAAINISSSDSRLECHQESGGPYSCVAASILFIDAVAYSFQVAARNSYGVGSLSIPVISTNRSLDTRSNCSLAESFRPVSTAAITLPDNYYKIEATTRGTTVLDNTTSRSHSESVASMTTAVVTVFQHCTCQEVHSVWTLAGSLITVIAILAAVVITVLLIINYMLWKRLRFSVAKKQPLQIHVKSDGIDMKECSAYGQVTFPQLQAVTGQQHIYESTI